MLRAGQDTHFFNRIEAPGRAETRCNIPAPPNWLFYAALACCVMLRNAFAGACDADMEYPQLNVLMLFQALGELHAKFESFFPVRNPSNSLCVALLFST